MSGRTWPNRLIELCDDPDLWTRLQALEDPSSVVLSHERPGAVAPDRRDLPGQDGRARGRRRAQEPERRSLHHARREPRGRGQSPEEHRAASRPRCGRASSRPAASSSATCCSLPIVAALRAGNELQVCAVLDAFDGSFFKGRFYARQPEAMIDVGNDREFGFLYQPEPPVLAIRFRAAFRACPCRLDRARRRSSSPRSSKVTGAVGIPGPSVGCAGTAFRCRSRGSRGGPGTRSDEPRSPGGPRPTRGESPSCSLRSRVRPRAERPCCRRSGETTAFPPARKSWARSAS